MQSIITIELGTNAVRVFAFDLDGKVIGSLKAYCPTFHPGPERSEQDPEQIFITMLYVLKNLLNEKIHPKKIKVASICFSSSMHSVLTVDKSGNPLGNAVIWADNRALKEARALKKSVVGEQIYHATGTPLHPMSPLAKIAWIKNNDSNRFHETAKFLSIKSYIIQQLTGECLIDYSLASATGLLNIHTIQWEAQALEFAGPLLFRSRGFQLFQRHPSRTGRGRYRAPDTGPENGRSLPTLASPEGRRLQRGIGPGPVRRKVGSFDRRANDSFRQSTPQRGDDRADTRSLRNRFPQAGLSSGRLLTVRNALALLFSAPPGSQETSEAAARR